MSDRGGQLLGVVALAATDRMRAAVEADLEAGGGVPAALVHVQAWPGGSVNELAGVLGLSQPATVRLVDRLVARGLVTRGPGGDGRTRALRCTEAGNEAAAALLERRQATLGDVLADLDDDERDTLEHLLERIVMSLADDRPAALRVCRLCDRTRCYAHGADICPLEHTTELPAETQARPIRYESEMQSLARAIRKDEAKLRARAVRRRAQEARERRRQEP